MAGRLHGLYSGTGSFNIVGRRRAYYAVSVLLMIVCLGSMVIRGFNFGIDFEGGTRFQLPSAGANGAITAERAERVYAETIGTAPASVQAVGSGEGASVLIRSETLDQRQTVELKDALFEQLQPLGDDGRPDRQAISDSAVSGTWGGEITQQAVIALLVFLALVSVFLALYFQPRMAIAAMVALLHDIVLTAGVYSMVGFEVTPASVIGLLTILGFSLYDTVVVFDKVQENTRGLLGLTRRTYREAANLAVNQTLMRSINTSIIAVLPVLGLLVIGVGLLGVGTLKDLALVQMVGMLAGTYSSIFLATPFLTDLMMRRSEYREQAERVRQRRVNLARKASAPSGDDEVESADAAADGTPPREGDLATVPGASTSSSGPAPPTKPRVGQRPARSPRGRPSGKSGRPTGKRRR